MLHHNEQGYTITELIIAIFISLILIGGSYATYITQNRSFVTQESVSETNTQSKIAHDLIMNDLKSSGFGVPTDMDLDPVNGLTTSIDPVDNDVTADAITVVGGFRMIGTLWPEGVNPGSACPNKLTLGTTKVHIIYSGTAGPNTTDKRSLTIDGVEFVRVQACNAPEGVCDTGTITLDRPLSVEFPLIDEDGDGNCDSGRPVYLVEDISYCVDDDMNLRRIRTNANLGNCSDDNDTDNELIAENIEDVQFAYAVDANGDGEVDDDGSGMLDAPDFVHGAAVADNSTIRAIRLNTLARSDRADLNFAGQGNPPASVENRNHDQTNDSFRRRLWQTIVSLRKK